MCDRRRRGVETAALRRTRTCRTARRWSCPAAAPRSCARWPARPARPPCCCCTAGPPPPTSTGSPATTRSAALPGGRARPSRPRPRHSFEEGVPAGGLRRRRDGGVRRAGHRPGHPRRLLDGRPDRPAGVAPPPRTGARLVLCATAPYFLTSREEKLGFLGLSGMAALARLTPAQARQWLTEQFYLQRKSDEWEPWAIQEAALHDWRMVLEAGRAIGKFNSREWIDDIDVPTSVLITMRDRVVPVRRQVRLFEGIHRRRGLPGRRRPRLRRRQPRAVRAHAAAGHRTPSSSGRDGVDRRTTYSSASSAGGR